MTPSEEMRALVFHEPGDKGVKTIPVPSLEGRKGYMLVKVDWVALNPTDWKHIAWAQGAQPFSIVGCDYAGTVVDAGDDAYGGGKRFEVGEKVYGCAHGSNQSQAYDGCFAEFAVVKRDVTMRVPVVGSVGEQKCSLEDLCTVGLGAVTVGQGLFQAGEGKSLGLRLPESKSEESGKQDGKKVGGEEWVFICGGSTATGTLGIQLAKLAGYKVIVTCSPRNESFVRGKGADEVVDYNPPECGAKVQEVTGNRLRYAWDTVGEWELCLSALSSDATLNRYYGTILGNEDDVRELWKERGGGAEGVKVSGTSMYTVFGESFTKYGEDVDSRSEDWEFGKEWVGRVEKWVQEGVLVPHPKEVRDGGLEGILEGLEDLKEERVRGVKLVYKVA